MARYIDLSHDITHQMGVFPADPAVGILTHHNYQNGYFVSQIIMGTHTGTHIDVPVHKIPGKNTVDKVAIDRFVGRAYVMKLDLEPLAPISAEVLEPFKAKVADVEAIIFQTGWSSHFGKEDFFTSFPGIDESGVNWLVENGIRLIGLETPSVNAIYHAEIHTLLLDKEIVIVESLNNVDAIEQEYVMFCAVPLKLKGLDGSPVRAYAIED